MNDTQKSQEKPVLKPESWYLLVYRLLRKQYLSKERSQHLLLIPYHYYQLLYNYSQLTKNERLPFSQSELLNDVNKGCEYTQSYEELKYLFESFNLLFRVFEKRKDATIAEFASRCNRKLVYLFMSRYNKTGVTTMEEWKKDNAEAYAQLSKYHWTLKDWENGLMSGLRWPKGYGEVLFHSHHGFLESHSLLYEEYQLIRQRSREIYEEHIQYNLDWYVEQFKNQLAISQEKELFRLDEIELIKRKLEDENYIYSIYYNRGKGLTKSNIQAFNPKKNYIAELYHKIIIRGEYDLTTSMQPEDANNYYRYIPDIATHVFYRYKKYLEGLKIETDINININTHKSGVTDTPSSYEEVFLSQSDFAHTLEIIRSLDIINDADKWIYGSKRKGAILVINDVLKKRNKIKTHPDQLLAQLCAQRLGTTISKRTVNNRPKYYDELFRTLIALIK